MKFYMTLKFISFRITIAKLINYITGSFLFTILR